MERASPLRNAVQACFRIHGFGGLHSIEKQRVRPAALLMASLLVFSFMVGEAEPSVVREPDEAWTEGQTDSRLLDEVGRYRRASPIERSANEWTPDTFLVRQALEPLRRADEAASVAVVTQEGELEWIELQLVSARYEEPVVIHSLVEGPKVVLLDEFKYEPTNGGLAGMIFVNHQGGLAGHIISMAGSVELRTVPEGLEGASASEGWAVQFGALAAGASESVGSSCSEEQDDRSEPVLVEVNPWRGLSVIDDFAGVDQESTFGPPCGDSDDAGTPTPPPARKRYYIGMLGEAKFCTEYRALNAWSLLQKEFAEAIGNGFAATDADIRLGNRACIFADSRLEAWACDYYGGCWVGSDPYPYNGCRRVTECYAGHAWQHVEHLREIEEFPGLSLAQVVHLRQFDTPGMKCGVGYRWYASHPGASATIDELKPNDGGCKLQYVPVHEVGHNFDANHEDADVDGTCPSGTTRMTVMANTSMGASCRSNRFSQVNTAIIDDCVQDIAACPRSSTS